MPSQATKTVQHCLMGNIWDFFGAADMPKSVARDTKGVLDKIVVLSN